MQKGYIISLMFLMHYYLERKEKGGGGNWNLGGSVIIERYLVFQHLAATRGEKKPES